MAFGFAGHMITVAITQLCDSTLPRSVMQSYLGANTSLFTQAQARGKIWSWALPCQPWWVGFLLLLSSTPTIWWLLATQAYPLPYQESQRPATIELSAGGVPSTSSRRESCLGILPGSTAVGIVWRLATWLPPHSVTLPPSPLLSWISLSLHLNRMHVVATNASLLSYSPQGF